MNSIIEIVNKISREGIYPEVKDDIKKIRSWNDVIFNRLADLIQEYDDLDEKIKKDKTLIGNDSSLRGFFSYLAKDLNKMNGPNVTAIVKRAIDSFDK